MYQPSTAAPSQPALTYNTPPVVSTTSVAPDYFFGLTSNTPAAGSIQQVGQQVLIKRGATTDPQIQEDRALVALIPQTQLQPSKSASPRSSTDSMAAPDSVKSKNAMDAYAKTSSQQAPPSYSASADVTLGRRA